jgi:two-component system, NtrC family, sensor kinase
MPPETSTVCADQSVEELRRELAEAREQQAAAREILRVISISPADPQPVFDAIVASAVRLLGGHTGSLSLVAGDRIELAALTSVDAAGDAAGRAAYPQSLRAERGAAHILRTRAPVNIADAYIDPRMSEGGRAAAHARGWRRLVAVPLLRHGEALGEIQVSRREPGGFSNDEIALIETFADQAVIAIENTRLFEAEQTRTREVTERTRELSEALEYQTGNLE